jgi:hypothetical protein
LFDVTTELPHLLREWTYSHTNEGTLAAAVAAAESEESVPVRDGMARECTSDE